MRCLTIKQPWAWAILHGKLVENRTWTTSYRGAITIHAGKRWDPAGQESPLVRSAWRAAGNTANLTNRHPDIVLGAVVAVAELVDVCSAQMRSFIPSMCGCGPWAAHGQYHWRLDNVRPLAEPVACRGALGLWTLPDDVEAAVVAQLGEQVSTRG
jgi:hypothetical protein